MKVELRKARAKDVPALRRLMQLYLYDFAAIDGWTIRADGLYGNDAIIEDYTASGERIDAIMDRLRASSTYAADIDKMPPDVHKPRAETMVAFLDQLDERFGGVIPWLHEHGYTEDDAARLRAELVR